MLYVEDVGRNGETVPREQRNIIVEQNIAWPLIYLENNLIKPKKIVLKGVPIDLNYFGT